MDTIVKYLDKSLDYVSHELIGDTLYINVMSNLKSVPCPDCLIQSSKVHSRYKKSFQDLPIQGKKVVIVIKNRNLFCVSTECPRYTFSETFDFIDAKSKKLNDLWMKLQGSH
ncbi:zinc-finger of transposase IS204/IS1001/IS1096/IS1165 [Anaerovirgula multivorans]|uniref:Zinc-finger of transposase IS204/IS1001/IS1096/IS1165 n=1 Tax=Anaerovirgula multivorans TaxID=312168 RepID=A0A239I859_9FIRM|nr:transposase family protein [Anaerovirgula multivorans]SNS88524.1 zinc-finger of transposase IS204/IS1001/IS1096/IS1165 [Anaerovirgula multivorans]